MKVYPCFKRYYDDSTELFLVAETPTIARDTCWRLRMSDDIKECWFLDVVINKDIKNTEKIIVFSNSLGVG